MMVLNKTSKEIENISDNVRKEYLKWVIKNCSSYVVTPKKNEHWLFDNVILTHWKTETGCSDNFETWSLNDIESAKEVFKTHHEMENN